MKKLIFLFTFLFFTISQNAQIQKLSALSVAKFLDSKTIYEENSDDVFGYFLLYKKDVKSSTIIELEAILLDKNLNKVNTKTFTIPHLSYWLFKGVPEITFMQKRGDKLLVNITEIGYADSGFFNKFGYPELRVFDLKTMDTKPLLENILDVNAAKTIEKAQLKNPTVNGFISFDVNYDDAMSGMMSGNQKYLKKISEFTYFDKDLTPRWTFKYNQDKDAKSFDSYQYFTENKNDIVFVKEFYEKKNDANADETIQFFDVLTGKIKFGYSIVGNASVRRMFFTESKIIIYALICEGQKKAVFRADKITGLQKIELDRATGKELSSEKLEWSALSKYLDIDDFGELKSGAFMHFLSFKHNEKTGKTALFAEGFIPAKNTKILDGYLLELDSKMAVTQFITIPKFKNRIDNYDSYGFGLEKAGFFDFLFSQNLPNNDGVVFYYVDNEKGNFAGRRNPNYVLGIVTYIDGKFEQQKISLKTNEGNIVPLKARQGYILLRETSKKETELRLEKINY